MVIPSALPFYAPSTPSALWASPPSKGGEEVSDREVKMETRAETNTIPAPPFEGGAPRRGEGVEHRTLNI